MMEDPDPYRITSVEELRQLYDMPGEMVLKTKFDFLDDHAVAFIRLCPIVCIGSEMSGRVDASPRGGEPGFIKVIDRRTLAIPDWPGNNKMETVTNILSSSRCGLVFMVPGHDLFLRLNGTATVTRHPDILKLLKNDEREPKLSIKVTVNEAYFHCGKALRRSKVWRPESWPPATALPTVGKMMLDQAKLADITAEDLDTMYQKNLAENLYS